jgi:septum formation topological specificity factor MinE
MTLSRERMAEYQRERRAKSKVVPVCQSCELLRRELGEVVKKVVALEKENLSLKDELSDKPDIPRPVIRPRLITVPTARVAHAINCSCGMCKPKKA